MRSGIASTARRALPALTVLLAAGSGDAAPKSPVRNAHLVEHHVPRVLVTEDVPIAATPSWAASLPAIEVRNRNTSAHEKLRLYADDGGIDRPSLRAFMRVASSVANAPDTTSGEVAEPLDPRLVQLVFRASYHFGGAPIVIVSATRKKTHGKHRTGDAIDFQLEGVRANVLAAYARTYPLAGVGIYTHPKTQYIHLDVRDRSYHWIDASPPGVTWRERLLSDPKQAERDASYAPVMDLP